MPSIQQLIGLEKFLLEDDKQYKDMSINWPEKIVNSNYKRSVVAMIGSTRFMNTFLEECWKLSSQGYVVTLPNFRPESMMSEEWEIPEETLEDIGYKRIAKADLVYVINKDGYIGSSTQKEIDFCIFNEIPIKYMECL